MGYRYYQVNWYSDNGEECSEDFDSKLEAMAFMEYNDFGKKAHPKMHTIDATHEFDEEGNIKLVEEVVSR